MSMNVCRLMLVMAAATTIPANCGTIVTSVYCHSDYNLQLDYAPVTQTGGGVGVASASCGTTGSQASASVTVLDPLNVTARADANISSPIFNGSSSAQASYSALLSLEILSPPASPNPAYVVFSFGGLGQFFTGFTLTDYVTQQNVFNVCTDSGGHLEGVCMSTSVSLFVLTITANATSHDNLKSFSGILEFLDVNRDPISGVHYALTDVSAPEPGTISLVLTGLLSAVAAAKRARWR